MGYAHSRWGDAPWPVGIHNPSWRGSTVLVLLILTCVALAVEVAWAAPTVRPTDPPSMAVEVNDGEAVVVLPVAPPPTIQVWGEAMAIGEDAPNQWMAGTRLAKLVNPTGSVVVGAVVPGSVVLRSAPGGAPYRVNEDYLLDERWAAVGRLGIGRIPKGGTVYADYAYQQSRLDTVQIPQVGAPSLRRGAAVTVCPHPAGPAKGHRAVANIWVRPGMTAVTAADIYPIGVPTPLPAADPAPTTATRRLLSAGAKVTIVALGDSVTCGGEASRPELGFPELFASTLRAKYPKANIALVNAGIGGTNSDLGLERLDKDVLAHRPNLVIIEFVNDFGWPEPKILDNYRQLISRIRAVGAEVVLITPHYIWPEWSGNFPVARAALLRVAAEEKVGLADAMARWANLKDEGIPYETLLVNCINHPDDRGHQMFVDALMELF